LARLLSDQRSRRKDLLKLERFILGDQWDDGRGWIGPRPKDGTADELIRDAFVQRNALREVATRHRDAVVGREPAWSLVPDRERGLKQLTTEAEDALTAWWDANGVLAALQEATLRLLFAEESSRGDEPPRPAVSPLRLFIRSSSVGEDGRVPKRG